MYIACKFSPSRTIQTYIFFKKSTNSKKIVHFFFLEFPIQNFFIALVVLKNIYKIYGKNNFGIKKERNLETVPDYL